MSKQAKINCPHCGLPITVRSLESQPDAQAALDLWEAIDEMFEPVEKGFKKIFNPKNWRL